MDVGTEAAARRCSSKFVLENFATFIGKHLCWILFLTKLEDFNTGVFL